MAISTFETFLMKGSSGTYTKLIDIKSFSDIGGVVEQLETTTLSDAQQTFIPGIKSSSPLEFTANYTKSDYDMLSALAGQNLSYAIYFGEAGADGKFMFNGALSVVVNGGGANEVVNMTITIVPSTEITTEE